MKIKKIIVLLVCIVSLILISIIANIEPDSGLFLFLFLFSLGIIIAILSLVMSKNFISGSMWTGIYVTVSYSAIFIIVPAIDDKINHIYTNEQISFLDFICPEISLPLLSLLLLMLISNLISFTLFYVIGKFFNKKALRAGCKRPGKE